MAQNLGPQNLKLRTFISVVFGVTLTEGSFSGFVLPFYCLFQTDANPECHVLSTSSASQFILERFGQKIGIIGLPDIDDEDQWLVQAKELGSDQGSPKFQNQKIFKILDFKATLNLELKKNQGAHMIIAMVAGSEEKVTIYPLKPLQRQTWKVLTPSGPQIEPEILNLVID